MTVKVSHCTKHFISTNFQRKNIFIQAAGLLFSIIILVASIVMLKISNSPHNLGVSSLFFLIEIKKDPLFEVTMEKISYVPKWLLDIFFASWKYIFICNDYKIPTFFNLNELLRLGKSYPGWIWHLGISHISLSLMLTTWSRCKMCLIKIKFSSKV